MLRDGRAREASVPVQDKERAADAAAPTSALGGRLHGGHHPPASLTASGPDLRVPLRSLPALLPAGIPSFRRIPAGL